jgi:hypothetical protein
VPVRGRAAVALELYLRESRPELAKRGGAALFLSTFGERLSIGGLRHPVKRHARTIGVSLTVAGWKRQLAQNVERVFEAGGSDDGSQREGELLKKIGELTVERDFLAKGLGRLR